MNVYIEIQEIEEAQDRLRQSQDNILDMYQAGNIHHDRILKETTDLINEYEELKKKYLALAEI